VAACSALLLIEFHAVAAFGAEDFADSVLASVGLFGNTVDSLPV
jgi:hypothetical protein